MMMSIDVRVRGLLLAIAMAVLPLGGCGEDSEKKIVNDAHPNVAPLAPGSSEGINSSKVDRGAAGGPAEGAP